LARLMIVEDDNETRKMIMKFLRYKNYSVIEARDGVEALEKLRDTDVNLILMDISMPKMNGIEATKKIREARKHPIIIMITAFSDEEIMKKAAEAGADDFIPKPINFTLLEARIKIALTASYFSTYKILLRERLISNLKTSENDIEELVEENLKVSFESLDILNKVAEFRDDETHEHTLRVGWMAGRLAEKLGLTPSFVTQIQFAAPLHDIGKVGIPDKILLKPAKLTNNEWKIMKKHAKIGYDILNISSSSKIIQLAATIALTHHERWNGSGYPQGLKGEKIPLSGSITAVADSFDAMISKRPYKNPIPFKDVYQEIVTNSGVLYSPDVVNAFVSLKTEIMEYYHVS
jgi:putative two-component system response regulator